ncbi:MAG TPA: hypothetical protein VIM69_13615, partial [Opitutaceae bacterium]
GIRRGEKAGRGGRGRGLRTNGFDQHLLIMLKKKQPLPRCGAINQHREREVPCELDKISEREELTRRRMGSQNETRNRKAEGSEADAG